MKGRVKELQNKFDKAELHGDRETLRELLADDFLSIGPKGFVLNKEEWVNRHDQFKYHELTTSEMDIRTYDKTAIVRNIQRNKAQYDNHPVQVATRVTQVWVNQKEQWRLAAIQFSPLAEQPQLLPPSK